MGKDARSWRSQALARTVAHLEREIEQSWICLCNELAVPVGSPDEAALCWVVVDDPGEFDWRVVDAALDRLSCRECGNTLATGPSTCHECDYYNGMRFAAREVDRPGVPAGNEHAIRVAAAVARTRARYSPQARVGYELLLPDLVAGALPSTTAAQAAKELINRLSAEECDRVTSMTEVERLARGLSLPRE